MTQTPYREKIRGLSDQLVAIQQPILILDAIKWPHEVKEAFLQGGGRQLPRIDRSFYDSYPLKFDPVAKTGELKNLKRSVNRQLGSRDPIARILKATIDQYLLVIELLSLRGTPGFLQVSRELWGSARDHLRGDRKTLIEMGDRLCHVFSLPAAKHLNQSYPKNITAEHAVQTLRSRLGHFFDHEVFTVRETDGIVSDAAAGGDAIKINTHASFSELDLKVLEVHEGWVHVGTTLNGREQPWATWLSVGSPRITAIQEGLAVLIETLTFSSFPDRAKRVSDRVVAIDLAEQGADFIEVYRHFLERGLSTDESYRIAQRVFRGGMVEGGACFTKDLSYVRGFVETVNFIRSAILSGVPEILPLLFVGKVTLDDIPVLYQYQLDGLITPPRYLPPMFRDLNGLYVWFGMSSGIALLDLGRVQRHFFDLFSHLPGATPPPKYRRRNQTQP